MQGAHPRQQLMAAPVSGNTHIQGITTHNEHGKLRKINGRP
jgi:hypothetical protein